MLDPILFKNPSFLTVKNCKSRRGSRFADMASPNVQLTIQTVITSYAHLAGANPLQPLVLSTGPLPSNVYSPFSRELKELKDASHQWQVSQ